jgi:hypothetical protein
MKFFLYVIPTVVVGWGGDAHRVVAKVASEFLRSNARWYVLEHLGGAGISQVANRMMFESTWADSISEIRPELDNQHFAHIPASGEVVGTIGKGDILEAMAHYTVRAADPFLSKSERSEAVKFLIHLMADIHSPVHIGFAKDMGGTQLNVKYQTMEGSKVVTTLHEIWDSVLIEHKEREICRDSQVAPWTLSTEILKSLPDRRSAEPYTLGLGQDEVSTVEKALKITSRIANEIAREFTTRFAYENESGRAIQQNEVLTSEYLSTRSEVAVELLKKAGVRLAEFLNLIARMYETRRFQSSPSRSATPQSVSAQTNRYLVLNTEFNPEELLFVESDELVESDSVIRPDADEGEMHPESSVSKMEPEASTVKATRSPEEIRKEQNRRRNERKKIKIRSVDGVDVKKAALVKRLGMYFVTSRDMAKTGEAPQVFSGYFVVFSRNIDSRPIRLSFDARLVGHNPTTRALTKCLAHILASKNNGAVEEIDFELIQQGSVDEDSLHFQSVYPQLKAMTGQVVTTSGYRAVILHNKHSVEDLMNEFDGQVKLQPPKLTEKQRRKKNAALRLRFGGNLPTKEEVWEADFASKINQICSYQYGRVILLIHLDTMKARPYADITATRFNVHFDPDDPTPYFILIDQNIYRGDLTSEISAAVARLSHTNARLSKETLKYRKYIVEELEDLHTVHFGTGENRLKSLKRIKFHRTFVAPDLEGLAVFFWSLRPWQQKQLEDKESNEK